jgi:predicted solute-binding protein
VRRDLNPEAFALLIKLIDKSLKKGLERIDQIAAKRNDLSMSVAEVGEYLRGFNYQLGRKEKDAIALFRNYLEIEGRERVAVDESTAREAPNAG